MIRIHTLGIRFEGTTTADALRIVTFIPVLHPLPHISVHIMQSPRIRPFPTDPLILLSILIIPRIILQPLLVTPKRPLRLRPRPTGILPLRLRRQAIPLGTFSLIHPIDKCLYTVPRYIHRRIPWMRRNAVLIPWRRPHHCLPLPLSHLILTQPKVVDLHHRHTHVLMYSKCIPLLCMIH